MTKIKFDFFFDFFSENVLETLLRGRETIRKKYRIVFEKFLKNMLFWPKGKKIVRNFLDNFRFFKIFEIFTNDVLKSVLRGQKRFRKKI